jgi:hypothetical protein
MPLPKTGTCAHLVHSKARTRLLLRILRAMALRVVLAERGRRAGRSHHRHPHAAEIARRGSPTAERLHDAAPEIGVAVLSQVSAPSYAYVLKERVSNRASLARVVREVPSGGSFVDPEVVVSLVAARAARPSTLDDLTDLLEG